MPDEKTPSLFDEPQPASSPLPRPGTPGQPTVPRLGMLEPEFHEHYVTWKGDPNPKNADKLIRAVKPVIDSALRTYVGSPASPTMRGRAKLLALDAAGKYDPTRAKLRTHLMVHLQGLRRHSANESQIVGVPERVGLDLHRVREATGELTDRLGREPSDQELADHVGLSRKRLTYVRQSKGGLAEGQMSSGGEEDSGFQPAVSQSPGGNSEDAWISLVYHDLGPVDQLILEHSLGLHGHQKISKQKIAQKLRLSPGAISQRSARIQSLLDRREDLGADVM